MFRARHFLDTRCDLKLLIIVKLRNVSSLAKTNLPRLILKERESKKNINMGRFFRKMDVGAHYVNVASKKDEKIRSSRNRWVLVKAEIKPLSNLY